MKSQAPFGRVTPARFRRHRHELDGLPPCIREPAPPLSRRAHPWMRSSARGEYEPEALLPVRGTPALRGAGIERAAADALDELSAGARHVTARWPFRRIRPKCDRKDWPGGCGSAPLNR